MVEIVIRDVRNAAGRSDYTGELRADASLRITDKNNTLNPGGPGPGTVSDTSFPVAVPCAATGDTSVGSTCALTTTANTLVPNVVVEGKRGIWQLGQVQRIADAGVDLLLFGTEQASGAAYHRLVSAARRGGLDAGRNAAAVKRIGALKANLPAEISEGAVVTFPRMPAERTRDRVRLVMVMLLGALAVGLGAIFSTAACSTASR